MCVCVCVCKCKCACVSESESLDVSVSVSVCMWVRACVRGCEFVVLRMRVSESLHLSGSLCM